MTRFTVIQRVVEGVKEKKRGVVEARFEFLGRSIFHRIDRIASIIFSHPFDLLSNLLSFFSFFFLFSFFHIAPSIVVFSHVQASLFLSLAKGKLSAMLCAKRESVLHYKAVGLLREIIGRFLGTLISFKVARY